MDSSTLKETLAKLQEKGPVGQILAFLSAGAIAVALAYAYGAGSVP